MAKKKKAAAKNAAVAPAPAAMGDQGFCEILRANRGRIYFNPATSEAACRITCDSIDASNPYRECSFNGIIFRQTPSYQCLIIGSGGKVHLNAGMKPNDCVQECNSREATNPLRTCVFNGITFRSP